MNKQASDPQQVQASLRKSVAKALERKRRLGQYAVVWRDGRPVRIEPDQKDYRVQEVDAPEAYRGSGGQGATKQDKP